VPQRVCEDCGRPWDWSPDGSKLLYLIEEGVRQPGLAAGVVDVATREKTVYLEHPSYSLARARFSPDGRWVSFTAISRANKRIVIAPVASHRVAREEQWITIAEEATVVDKSRWSPDGNLLYFISEADGYRCIRARRLDPATKRPVGPPIDVYHSHSARRSLMNPWLGLLEISVSPDKLLFNLGETTGNIWMAEWKP
jgi:Tol biopolymer transport system component